MTRVLTLEGDFLRMVQGVADREEAKRWPSPLWKDDPERFAYEVLGVRLWKFQLDLVDAIQRGANGDPKYRHIAVAGGRKIGKDFGVGIGAIWFYSTWTDSRVFLLAPTGKQLDGILYREIRILWSRAGRCVACLERDAQCPRPCPHSFLLSGKVGEKFGTGIHAPDFREIVGATAVNEGSLRGFSGARILAVEDEASDIKDDLDTALVGNLAGLNCVRVAISNPTKTTGFFYRAFHEEKALFHTIQQSSEDNPNVTEGRTVFPGLADHQWLKERELAWGRGSPLWMANVEGKFVRAEEGQLFTIEDVKAAEERWLDASDEHGRLSIGIDVAGESGLGDEWAMAPKRFRRVLDLVTGRGLKHELYVDKARELIARFRRPWDVGDDRPIVVVDRDGKEGAEVWDAFRAYQARGENEMAEFELVGFRGSAPPNGSAALTYRFARDQLFAGLQDAFKDGLGIPSDLKLEAELVVLRWRDVERGRSQLMHKSEIKEKIGRSPDRLDGVALSTWVERRSRVIPEADPPPPPPKKREDDDPYEAQTEHETVMDPYGGGPDPYGRPRRGRDDD